MEGYIAQTSCHDECDPSSAQVMAKDALYEDFEVVKTYDGVEYKRGELRKVTWARNCCRAAGRQTSPSLSATFVPQSREYCSRRLEPHRCQLLPGSSA